MQRQVRADMVRLYGNSKRLVPRSMGFTITGNSGRAFYLILLLQVRVVH